MENQIVQTIASIALICLSQSISLAVAQSMGWLKFLKRSEAKPAKKRKSASGKKPAKKKPAARPAAAVKPEGGSSNGRGRPRKDPWAAGVTE